MIKGYKTKPKASSVIEQCDCPGFVYNCSCYDLDTAPIVARPVALYSLLIFTLTHAASAAVGGLIFWWFM